MIGVEIDFDARKIVDEMLERGFLINATGVNTLRLVLPLIITKDEIDIFVRNLDEILMEL